jgi:hypothetical protein
MVYHPALTVVLAATFLLPTTLAVPETGTFGLKFERRSVNAEEYPHLRRRQSNTVQAGLSNEISLYLINVTVGTPAQSLSLQIDTGSSDVWFPTNDANVCQQDGGQDCPVGTFDASSSSTLQELDGLGQFQIEYVDGTQIEGVYISDDLSIGDTKITNLTMAAATKLNALGVGIMGLSFAGDESIAANSRKTFPTIIDVMQSEGIIKSKSYSLWLDDVDSNTGSILFGGVDADKFKGDLVSLPIQLDAQTGAFTSFSVAWTGLKVTGSGNNADLSPSSPVAAILDSGTTDTLLPDDIAEALFNGIGAATVQGVGNVVPCEVANDDLTFAFTFGGDGGVTINVPVSEFVIPIPTTDGETPKFQDGKAACQVAVEAAGSNPVLFGDSFLRSAYVVYDLDNLQIALAETNFDAKSGNGNVQAISSGSSAAIPGVTSTASGASVAQSFSGIPRESGEATATGGSLGGAETSRSATFMLSATGSGGGSTTTASGLASGSLLPGPFEWQGVFVSGAVMLSMMLGGGILLA